MKPNNKRIMRKLDKATIVFLIYASVLCFLLFCRSVPILNGISYKEMLETNYNIKPFSTIDYYIRILRASDDSYLVKNAVINLAGNVIMFIPLGLYLPYKFSRLEKVSLFLLLVCTVILVVEILQFFTLLGYCDIDDLILNVLGAFIGFVIYKIIINRKK